MCMASRKAWRTAFGGLPSEQRDSHHSRVASVRLFRCSEVARAGAFLTEQIVGVHQLAQAQRQAATTDTAA
jgi:hypothetical protein